MVYYIEGDKSGQLPTFLFSGKGKMPTVDLVVERVRTVALPVIESLGMTLVDVEFRREARGWVLRLYLDRPEGITLAHCQEVSEQLSDLLDVEDLVDHPYSLEVSSPGLDRLLKTPQDFVRFAGQPARIETRAPIGGQRRFRGLLEGCREGMVILRQAEGPTLLLPLEAIAKARLEIKL